MLMVGIAAVAGAFTLLFYVALARAIDYRNILLFAVVATIPLRNVALLTIGGANVRIGDVFLMGAVAVFLLELLVHPRSFRSFTAVHAILIAFLVWGATTVLWSLDPKFGVVREVKYIRNFAMFLLIAHWMHGRFTSGFRSVAHGVVGSFVYITPVVYKRMVAAGVNLETLANPQNVGLLLNRLRGPAGISGGTFSEGGTVLALASWSMIGILLWLGLGYWRSPRRLTRLTFWIVLATMGVIEFLTFSRGAWGAVAAGAIWWFVRLGRALPRRTRLAAIAFVILSLGVAVRLGLYEMIVSRIVSVGAVRSEEDASINLRRQLWGLAIDAIKARPMGVGLGGTTQAVGVYVNNVWFIHNLYLQLLAEVGPVGLALVLAAIGVSVLRLARAARAPVDRETRVAAIALIGAFMAYVIMSFIDFDLTEMEIWVLFAVAAAVPWRQFVFVTTRPAVLRVDEPAPAPS